MGLVAIHSNFLSAASGADSPSFCLSAIFEEKRLVFLFKITMGLFFGLFPPIVLKDNIGT